MQDSDKILTRLIDILKKLSNNEKPKVKELALEYSVTQRTIQRDLYQRLPYFPIEKNSSGELKFIDGFSIEQSILDNDEMLFTYLALSKVKEDNPHFQDKIYKILKKLIKPQKNNVCYINPDINKNTIQPEFISTIEDAILKNKIITIELKDESKQVQPYKILDNKTSRILLAQDCMDKKVKSISLLKIQNVYVQKHKFKTKKSLDETLSNVHSSFFTAHHAQEFEVLVQAEVANYFKMKTVLPSQEVLQKHEDGSITIKFIAETDNQVENIIKTWMPYLKITKPATYNQTIISKMQKYIDICST